MVKYISKKELGKILGYDAIIHEVKRTGLERYIELVKKHYKLNPIARIRILEAIDEIYFKK